MASSVAKRDKLQLSLIKELKPNVVIGIQKQDELEPIIVQLRRRRSYNYRTLRSTESANSEKRKAIREITYAKYLKKSKLQCIPVSQIIVEPRNGVPKTQEPEKGILVGLYGRGTKFLGIGVLRAINVGRRTLKIQTAVLCKAHEACFRKSSLE